MFFSRKADSTKSVENDVAALQHQALCGSPDATVLAIDGVIAFANMASAKLLGLGAPKDVVGRKLADLLAPQQHGGVDAKSYIADMITQYTKHGHDRRNIAFLRADRSQMVARALIVMAPHPTKRIGLMTFEDISDWLKEQEMIEAAARALSRDGTVSVVAQRLAETSKALALEGNTLSSGAEKANGDLEKASRSAQSAAENARAIADAGEELSSTVASIATRLQASEQITSDAVREAGQVSSIVSTLSEAAGKIDDVVQLINNIAGQTNLLALNATIEAARAGEAGRGFAVVASEVKALANQTAKATEDIQNQIGNVQAASRSSVQAISRISEIIDGISRDSREISGAVREQGVATNSIVEGIHRTLKDTQALAQTLGSIGTTVNTNQQSASRLSEQTNELKAQAEKLSDEVRGFAGNTRR